jgi:competence protein ComEA
MVRTKMANQSEPGVIKRSGRKLTEMDLLRYRHVPAIALLAVLAGCTQKESPQQLQQQTARATAEVKSDAKAVAEGIREGWSRDRPLDLNSATREQLVSLPGVTESEADHVIAGRPYGEPGELVTRHIMAKPEYDRIADRVTAKR